MQVSYESVPYRPGESIACFEFNGPRILCPYHQHPEFEIAWIVRSEGRVLAGDSLTRFQAGDLFLLGAHLPHAFWNDDDSGNARTVVVQFKRDAFGEKLFAVPETLEIARLLVASERGLRWNIAGHPRLARVLHGLGARRETGRIIQFLEVLRQLAQMAPAAELSSIACGQALKGRDSSRMETVTQYVRGHLTETISQTEAARLTGMSVSSFRRFFQRTARRTFPCFVNELRISEACRLLLTTDLTVTEILYRCGYSNPANFYRRFRQVLGTTPKGYRRRERATAWRVPSGAAAT